MVWSNYERHKVYKTLHRTRERVSGSPSVTFLFTIPSLWPELCESKIIHYHVRSLTSWYVSWLRTCTILTCGSPSISRFSTLQRPLQTPLHAAPSRIGHPLHRLPTSSLFSLLCSVQRKRQISLAFGTAPSNTMLCFAPQAPRLLPRRHVKLQVQRCRSIMKISRTALRTFTTTSPTLAKGPNDRRKESQQQRDKIREMERRIDRASTQHSLASQRAMSNLIHELRSATTSAEDQKTVSHQARVDRIHADMEYIHAEVQHRSSMGEMIRQHSKIAVSSPLQNPDTASMIGKKKFVEGAFLTSKKALRASLQSAVPTVFAPRYVSVRVTRGILQTADKGFVCERGEVALARRLGKILWLMGYAGPRFALNVVGLKLMLLATRATEWMEEEERKEKKK